MFSGSGFFASPAATTVVFYPSGLIPGGDETNSLRAIPCTVTAVASDGTSVTCTTGVPPSGVDACAAPITGSFILATNKVFAQLAGSTSFTYSLDSTTIVTAFTTTGSPDFSFTLSGLNFVGPVKLSLAPRVGSSIISSAVTVTGTTATGTLSGLVAGSHGISAMSALGTAIINATLSTLAAAADSAVSLGATQGALVYTCPLVIYSLKRIDGSAVTSTGSTAGGQRLLLTGWGFSPLSSAGTVKVSLSTSGGTVAGYVVSANTSFITFKTGPLPTSFSGASYVADVSVTNVDSTGLALTSAVTLAASYTYATATTPTLISVSSRTATPGAVLTLVGTNLGAAAADVTIGGVTCVVDSSSWTASGFNCTLGNTPAGTHRVLANFPFVGLAKIASSVTVTVLLSITSGGTVVTGGHGGGSSLTITGAGFASANIGSTTVSLCGSLCSISSVTYNSVTCTTAPLVTAASLNAFRTINAAALSGTPFGYASGVFPLPSGAARVRSNVAIVKPAFDGSVSTPFSSVCTLGLDFGANSWAIPSSLKFYGAYGSASNFVGGTWYGTTVNPLDDVAFSATAWTTLATVTSATEGWNELVLAPAKASAVADFSTLPAYRSVMFVFSSARSGSQCTALELKIEGYAVSPSGPACAVNVTVQQPTDVFAGSVSPVSKTPSSPFTYSQLLTPLVTAISPNNGSALGGTVVSLTGSGFGSTASGVAVVLNGVACAVTAVSSTVITCTTGARDSIRALSVSVTVPDSGLALVPSTVSFRYLDRWSSLTTWSGNEPPVSGDTVIVPDGQAILVDVSPPRLFLVYVAGLLVFDNADLAFNASYIFVHGGALEVGSEAAPFMNKLTITLHGDRYTSVEIPNLGAKVLGVMNRAPASSSTFAAAGSSTLMPAMLDDNNDLSLKIGRLDLHGAPRLAVWTKLAATALRGSTVLTLADDVDWAPGEHIAITSSSTNLFEAEEIVVAERLSSRSVRISTPLAYDHVANIVQASQWGGHDAVDMRCEVGLLSRNVVIQGDDASDAQSYGCHNIASMGGVFRYENVEVRKCGQRGGLGRYSTHMHMLGSAGAGNYVRNNSIHDSFQRMTTIHATDYAVVEGNFGFRITGHSLFVEDGVEKYNVFQNNLIAGTVPLFEGMKSDTSPASFWCASPTNFWRNNVAGGSTAEGFWFELPGNPHGPSFTTTVCPDHAPLGEWSNNAAHSNGAHGLRIYPFWDPSNVPCDGTYGSMAANLINFTSWHNSIGIFHKITGAVRHKRPRTIENGLHYLLLKVVGHWAGGPSIYSDTDAHIQQGLMIGSVDDNSLPTREQTRGFLLPQTEMHYINGLHIVNFGDSPVLTGCNKCDSDVEYRQGAYSYRTRGLTWIRSNVRTFWNPPYKDIFLDLDGTLTGYAGGTAVAYFPFNSWPECARDTIGTYNYGHVCDNTVAVRRMQLDGVNPYTTDFTNLNVSSRAGSGAVLFRIKEFYGWSWPMVTNKDATFPVTTAGGQKDYTLRFGTLSDWQSLRLRYSEPELVKESGEWTRLTFVWNGERYRNQVLKAGSVEVSVLPAPQVPVPTTEFGAGTFFYNATSPKDTPKEWTVGLTTANVSGVDPKTGASCDSGTCYGGAYGVSVAGIQCPPGGCYVPPAAQWSETALPWSDPLSWPSGIVPAAGETVLINYTMNILLDVSPPPLTRINVLGRLAFADSGPISLTAGNIVVYGLLECGTARAPHQNVAEIVLTGGLTSPTPVVDNNIWNSNKVLLVLGKVSLHGIVRNTSWTKLNATANVGDTTLRFSSSVAASWSVGDKLTIGPTEWDLPMQEETVQIASISMDGRTVTLTSALAYRHYAGPAVASPTSAAGRAAIIAAPVGLLTRNVIVRGNVSAVPILQPDIVTGQFAYSEDTYGGHIFVSQITRPSEPKANWRIGSIDLRYVELRNMGKTGTQFASVNVQYGAFLLANMQDTTADLGDRAAHPVNLLRGCSLSFSFNIGFDARGARNVALDANVIHQPRLGGINIDVTSLNATLTSNAVINLRKSPVINAPGTTQWAWPTAAFFIDAPYVARAWGNVAAGSNDAGFTYHPELSCGASAVATAAAGFPALGNAPQWSNNEAIATLVGVFALPTAAPASFVSAGGTLRYCGLRVGGFSVAKAAHIGVVAVDGIADLALVDSVVAECHIGVSFNFFRAKQFAQSRGDVVNTLIVGNGPATAVASGSACPASSKCRAMHKDDADGADTSTCRSVFGNAYSRVGIMSSQYTNRGKTCSMDGELDVCRPSNRPTRMCSLPWEMRYGLWNAHNAQLYLTGVTFAGFGGVSVACGAQTEGSRSVAYAHNPAQCDVATPVFSNSITWDGVPLAGRFSFRTTRVTTVCTLGDPRGGDGFATILLQDADGSLTGTPKSSVLGPNPALGEDAPLCTFNSDWNGILCPGLPFRAGIYESVDRDRGFRRMGNLFAARLPVAAALDSGSVNWSNRTSTCQGVFDDTYCVMRMYFGQIPFIARPGFPLHLMTPLTEPSQQRFHFFSNDPTESIVVKYYRQRPNSVQVWKTSDDTIVDGATSKTSIPGLNAAHGANLFDPQAKHFTLVLRGAANWETVAMDVVALPSVQLSITLAADPNAMLSGGTAGVVSNLALLLGIDASRIKVVSVAAAIDSPSSSPGSSPMRILLSLWRRELATGSTLQIEILPPANSTVRSSVIPEYNISTDGTVAGTTTPDVSMATETTMIALATTITSLQSTGQVSSLGGYPVTAMTVTPPTVAAASPTAATSPSHAPPPPTALSSFSSSALSSGSVAGIVVGVLFAVIGSVALALVLHKNKKASLRVTEAKSIFRAPKASGADGAVAGSFFQNPATSLRGPQPLSTADIKINGSTDAVDSHAAATTQRVDNPAGRTRAVPLSVALASQGDLPLNIQVKPRQAWH